MAATIIVPLFIPYHFTMFSNLAHTPILYMLPQGSHASTLSG
uniref:Uncharacterized protein n=1 Tax=Arundo donax TaxID=35708 RepID=A0A0A9QV01_ARUDO